MLNIFICEDNHSQRDRIQKLIKNYLLIEDFEMEIALSTSNPDKILAFLNENPQNHAIYFLDIYLNATLDGIQLAAKIRDLDIHGKIIFITSYSEFQPLTFKYKVEALDYIPKDDFKELEHRIREVLALVHYQYQFRNTIPENHIRLQIGSQVRMFDLSDIMFIETSHTPHKLLLHLSNQQIEFYGRISELLTVTDKFIQVHKSFIINYLNIDSINNQNRMITFKNGETCLISKRQSKSLHFFLTNPTSHKEQS